MSKHMPGPWTVEETVSILRVHTNGAYPAEIALGRDYSNVDAANAHLIAAAPDLYATLEYIIEALEMRAREHDCKGIHCSTCNPMELVEMGREAVAKADERKTTKV